MCVGKGKRLRDSILSLFFACYTFALYKKTIYDRSRH